jgi:hypothetical protein
MEQQQYIDTAFTEDEQPISPEDQKAREAAAKEGFTALQAAVKETEARGEEYQKFDLHQRQARLFAASGLFGQEKDRNGKLERSVAEAIAAYYTLIEIGEGMGFSAAQSVMGIDVIQGRPAVGAQLRAARLAQLGYTWRLEWLEDAKTGECTGIRIWPFFKGRQMTEPKQQLDGSFKEVPLSVKYDKSDAQRMLTTVWDNNVRRRVSILEKDNWKMSPRNMYFARCITNFQRWYAPHAIASNILDTGEAEDNVDFNAPIQFAEGSAEQAESVRERKLADPRNESASVSAPATDVVTSSSPATTSEPEQSSIFAGASAVPTPINGGRQPLKPRS